MEHANTVNQSCTPATQASRRAGFFFDTSFWHYSGGHNLLADRKERRTLFCRDTSFWHHLTKTCQDRLLCEGMWIRREANYVASPKAFNFRQAFWLFLQKQVLDSAKETCGQIVQKMAWESWASGAGFSLPIHPSNQLLLWSWSFTSNKTTR